MKFYQPATNEISGIDRAVWSRESAIVGADLDAGPAGGVDPEDGDDEAAVCKCPCECCEDLRQQAAGQIDENLGDTGIASGFGNINDANSNRRESLQIDCTDGKMRERSWAVPRW